MNADIAALTSGRLDPETNAVRLEARVPLTSLDDYEPFGEIDAYVSLGLTARPFTATNKGHAEGVVLRDVGGQDGVVVGARDTRCSDVYKNLKEGEVVLHSVEPDAKSQVRCSPDGQISAIITDANGDTAALLIDGKNNKFQFAGFGAWFEISEDNGVLISAPGGKASIMMKDEAIILAGKVSVGTTQPSPAHQLILGDTVTVSALNALGVTVKLGANTGAALSP